jgi:hypothetical protein
MSETYFLIENCTADDFEYACPRLWTELKASLTAAVRHCDHCNRKVYLCKTDADIKLYTSVNYCIAIADTLKLTTIQKEALSKAAIEANSADIPPRQGVQMIGVMLPCDSREWQARIRAIENEMDVQSIPDFLRRETPHNRS